MKKLLLKIDNLNSNKVIGVSILIWVLINLLQASFTELAHDEAYYWMYSKYLAWGYFDHPPMVAVLIKAGYFLFHNELGVRLFSIFLGAGTFFLTFKLTHNAKISTLVFVLFAFSVALGQTHAFGFLAIPDIPVVFFSTCFLLALKKYLEKDSYAGAALLGVLATLMLYSKYHAVLVMFFCILPNLSLFKRKSFYIIPGLIIILMLPHLFWQIQNGFPTFEYHLVSRSSAYTPLHTWNYLYSQFLIAGPFVAIPAIYHAVKYKTENQFELTLKWLFYGFFFFFLLASFRGHMEAHWTAVAIVPMVILAYNNIAKSDNAKRWIIGLSVPSILFILFVRIALIFPILPKIPAGKEFHNWDNWAAQIQDLAKGKAVVFTNSFQRPAKYSFYTGEISHSDNNLRYRKNQYDIWNLQDSLMNRKVIVFNGENSSNFINTCTGERYSYDTFDCFISYKNFKIETDIDIIEVEADSTFNLGINVINIDSLSNKMIIGNYNTYISAIFANKDSLLKPQELHYLSTEELNSIKSFHYSVSIKAPNLSGDYQCFISLHHKKSFPGFQSYPFKVSVK